MSIITICTDASFNRKRKIATYAFYIRFGHNKIVGKGMLRGKTENPQDAEMKAVGNAAHVLLKKNIGYFNKIIINTDSKCMSHKLFVREKKGRVTKKLAEILTSLVENVSDPKSLPATIEIRHVKAHTESKEKRSLANEFCDMGAKEEMGKYIFIFDNKKKSI